MKVIAVDGEKTVYFDNEKEYELFVKWVNDSKISVEFIDLENELIAPIRRNFEPLIPDGTYKGMTIRNALEKGKFRACSELVLISTRFEDMEHELVETVFEYLKTHFVDVKEQKEIDEKREELLDLFVILKKTYLKYFNLNDISMVEFRGKLSNIKLTNELHSYSKKDLKERIEDYENKS